MRIALQVPSRIDIDVVETDDRLPSMCCNVTIEANQFLQRLHFRDRAWISCSTWDSFVKGLTVDDCTNPELFDIERRLVLRVLKSTAGFQVSFEGRRTHSNGVIGKMAILAPLHREEFAVVARKFADFERWW
ncbi:hypothetical protein [Paraburkholderia sabiae]|uniref:hypothetical protein n=1 Tax=Paraburkholderia sabiae TaxID=273251 RepID=UPI001919E76C|nr:hypothetical protein [Paraburkholderia sabiae]WJZ79344.1 hypothetical protein QEN71_41680 [Paraburkholderia sabiae]